MSYGIIGYSQPGSLSSTTQVGLLQSLPSGSIWGDCSSAELLDEATGYFTYKTFKDDATLPGLPNYNGTYSAGSADDSSLNIAVTSTGAAGIFVRPMAPIAPNGSSKLWMEANIAPQQTTNQSMFVGFATSTGLAAGLLASSTTLIGTAGLIGFWLHGDAPANVDAIYQKPSGSPVTVLASVLTANANNPNPANVNYVPAIPPGAFTGSNAVKLGVRVDKQYAWFYVNGSLVAKKLIDATFDTADSYGATVAIATQTANTDNLKVSFFKAAAKLF